MPEFQPFRLADSMQAAQGLAMNQFRLNDMANTVKAKADLSAAVGAGTPEAMAAYEKAHPVEARQFQSENLAFKKQKLDYHLAEVGAMARLAGGVSDQSSYDRALAEAKDLGIDVSRAPPQYDPGWVKQMSDQALDAKARLEAARDAFDREHKNRVAAETERSNRENERLKGEKNKIDRDRATYERDSKARDVEALVKSGVPRTVARGEVYNTIKKIQDPLSFETKFIDIATDKEVGTLDNKGRWNPGPGSASMNGAQPSQAAPPPAGATSAPAPIGGGPTMPPGIPPGSSQIGTSGGKPVYQAPDGKRYIVD